MKATRDVNGLAGFKRKGLSCVLVPKKCATFVTNIAVHPFQHNSGEKKIPLQHSGQKNSRVVFLGVCV